MTDSKTELWKTALWFVPSCIAAGVINGLLGAGGGVIMLYLVCAVLGKRSAGKNAQNVQRDAFASVIAIILPVSVVSAISYAAKGAIDMEKMQKLILPALAGGIIGAYLTDRLPTRIIRGVFALLVIISGIRMVR